MKTTAENELHKSAVLSDCGLYRFRLDRWYDRAGISVAFCLCNPSKANGLIDDPTSRRGIGFMNTWGFGHMIFVNANPFMATDPNSQEIPPMSILRQNDMHLEAVCAEADLIVAAWGDKVISPLAYRAHQVMARCGRRVSALRTTKKGNPSHLLYLPGNLRPFRWG